MDAVLADTLIFFLGLLVGGSLVALVALKAIGVVISDTARIFVGAIVEKGYFLHDGVRYTVKPHNQEGT
jgi:hypothetical protein